MVLLPKCIDRLCYSRFTIFAPPAHLCYQISLANRYLPPNYLLTAAMLAPFHHASRLRARLPTLLVCGALLPAILVAQPATRPSPFSPPTRAAPAPAAADPDFEFTGVIEQEKTTIVNLTRIADRRTTWVIVGATVAGLAVSAYDPASRQVTFTAAGRSRTLPLKAAPALSTGNVGNFDAFTAAPLPVATVALREPVTDAEKATEARMLISDLLEIGMLQRQAYEDAARKAAAEAANRPATTPPAAVAPANP